MIGISASTMSQAVCQVMGFGISPTGKIAMSWILIQHPWGNRIRYKLLCYQLVATPKDLKQEN